MQFTKSDKNLSNLKTYWVIRTQRLQNCCVNRKGRLISLLSIKPNIDFSYGKPSKFYVGLAKGQNKTKLRIRKKVTTFHVIVHLCFNTIDKINIGATNKELCSNVMHIFKFAFLMQNSTIDDFLRSHFFCNTFFFFLTH